MTLFNRGERAILMAGLYLAALFVSCIVMWWFALFGGNPYTVTGHDVVNSKGQQAAQFHPGDRVAIRWELCSSSRPVSIEYRPSLLNDGGVQYHLPNGMMRTQEGCFESTHGFVVPKLPAGQYTYQVVIVFQNNLVGRDQAAELPPVHIEVLP